MEISTIELSSFHLAPVEELDDIKMNYEANNGPMRSNKFDFDC